MTAPLSVVLILPFTPNERRVAQDRPVCQGTGRRGGLRRRQVKKVDYYYLSVDSLPQPMRVQERPEPYGKLTT